MEWVYSRPHGIAYTFRRKIVLPEEGWALLVPMVAFGEFGPVPNTDQAWHFGAIKRYGETDEELFHWRPSFTARCGVEIVSWHGPFPLLRYDQDHIRSPYISANPKSVCPTCYVAASHTYGAPNVNPDKEVGAEHQDRQGHNRDSSGSEGSAGTGGNTGSAEPGHPTAGSSQPEPEGGGFFSTIQALLRKVNKKEVK